MRFNRFLMNKRRTVVVVLGITMIVLAQLACESATMTPFPVEGQGAYSAAQATLQDGPRQAMELSYQATALSLNMNQAANAAAQTTIDYNRRQLMELSIRGTEVSQNMAWAAATQQASSVQTQMAWNAMVATQSQAATEYAGQTAQAQAIATQTAFSLTATPLAAIQAGIERRAWWQEYVISPVKVTLLILVVLMLIVGGVLAYRRLMPVLELRLRTISRDTDSDLRLVDGMIVDSDPSQSRLTQHEMRLLEHPTLPGDELPQVEIVGSSEPTIINWIIEAEQKLRSDGWIQP
jgi:hypothetical protein